MRCVSGVIDVFVDMVHLISAVRHEAGAHKRHAHNCCSMGKQRPIARWTEDPSIVSRLPNGEDREAGEM